MNSVFPAFRASGQFVFSSSMAGWDGAGEAPHVAAQCERSYSLIQDGLAGFGLSCGDVVRLDHHTASQGWLAERQEIRASFFGAPCNLASTGVAVEHSEGLAVSTATIAAVGGPGKVVIGGADFGMAAIATAVEAADHLFVSGILKISDDASANIAAAVAEIAQIRRLSNYSDAAPVRFDVYVASGEMAAEACARLRREFGDSIVLLPAVLPFAGPAMIEVTSLFRKAGKRGLSALPTVCGDAATMAQALRTVQAAAAAKGQNLARIDLRYPPGHAAQALALAGSLPEEARPVCVAFPGSSAAVADGPFAMSGFLAEKG